MPGEVNCIFTKGLIPFVEKAVGPEGVAAICRVAGRSRDYLMADHNWIPLAVADEMVKVCQRLMNEPDEERWARRYGESFMDWKPRDERSYLGTYSMGIGSPRAAYERVATIYSQQSRFYQLEILDIGRAPRALPVDAGARPAHAALGVHVAQGAVRALSDQLGAAARRDPREHVRCPRRRRVPLGDPVAQSLAGRPLLGAEPGGRRRLGSLLGALFGAAGGAWPLAAVTPLPLLAGVALGYALREGHQRRHVSAPARSSIRGDHLLEPRAREEVRRARDADRAALAPHGPERRGERDPRPGEDLRPGALAPGSPDGLRAGPPVPRGPCGRRAPGPPDGRRRPRGPSLRARRAAPGPRGQRQRAGSGHPAARPRQRRRPADLSRQPRDGPRPSGARPRRGASSRARAGLRRPHRERVGAGAVRPGRRGPPGHRGQPRGARDQQRRELPDHRGALADPRGQGAGAHRAAPDRQRGAAGRVPRPPGGPDAAGPAGEDGLRRPARGRSRPRAQQPDRIRLLERDHAGRLHPPPAGDARRLRGGRASRRRTARGSPPGGRSSRSTTRSSTWTP